MSEATIPHHFQLAFPRDDGAGNAYSMNKLYVGEVQEVIYPDDERNLSGKFLEFNVIGNVVINGVPISKPFHCILMNKFGSVADKESYTLRADTKLSELGKAAPGLGSKVLFACINGDAHNAVIIGGINDQTDAYEKKVTKKDSGHRYLTEYNGVSLNINDSGELFITFRGKTGNDGKLHSSADAKAAGTSIRITKEGNLSIADRDDRNQVYIDHANDRVLISAAAGVAQLNSDGVMLATSSGAVVNLGDKEGAKGVTIHDPSGNNIALNSDGITAVDSAGSSVTLFGDGTVQVAGDSVVVSGGQVDVQCGSGTFGQGADSFMVRGDQLKTIMIALTTALTTFSNSLTVEAGAGAALVSNLAPIIAQINTIMLSQSNKVK